MDWEDLLEKTGRVFEKEPRLISLPSEGKGVFVGDTHGDLEASREVIKRYLKKPYPIVCWILLPTGISNTLPASLWLRLRCPIFSAMSRPLCF